MENNFLIEGKIPAHTVCAWRRQCATAEANICWHNGIEHPKPFSCATARGFEIAKIPQDITKEKI
jgi:hypothetical protein